MMQIKKLIFLNPSKENNNSTIDKEIPTQGGVYFLYDRDLELIYIGVAQNIRSRISQHTSKNNKGRLRVEDKSTYWESSYNTCIPYGIVEYYSCIIEKDKDKRKLIETFFHTIIKTRFNNTDKIKSIEMYFKDKPNLFLQGI